MNVPTWILDKNPAVIQRRWRQFMEGIWEPSEWVEAEPLLFRPWGAVEGAHLYRFGNTGRWKGRPVLDAETPLLVPVLQRLWQEYPCLFLPRTLLTAWLIGHRQEPPIAALIEEILAWPEGQKYPGSAVETLRGAMGCKTSGS